MLRFEPYSSKNLSLKKPVTYPQFVVDNLPKYLINKDFMD
jgi:hypothetical protein